MILALTLTASLAVGPTPSLSEKDEAAIMRLLCEHELTRDGRGWVCTDPETIDGVGSFQQRWQSAWPGRFIEQPGEWVVTLYRTCDFAYCPFDSYVVRKTAGKWRTVRELDSETAIGNECVRIGGAAGALDRLACLSASGPNQGFMFERLVLLSFAGGKVTEQVLMARGQGGEGYLQPPEKEVRGDEIAIIGDDGTALTVRLKVRAAPCDPAQPEGNGPFATRGEHVLRFRHDGAALGPDAATAEIIRRYDWLQSP